MSLGLGNRHHTQLILASKLINNRARDIVRGEPAVSHSRCLKEWENPEGEMVVSSLK